MVEHPSERPKVFISYSHEDERWKELLLRHLRVLQRQSLIDIWDTSEIDPGVEWSDAIAAAARESEIAILLLSSDFLASDFIAERELPLLLTRRREEGLIVLPILVRPASWTYVRGLAELEFLNDPSTALSDLPGSERDRVLAFIAERVMQLAGALRQSKIAGTEGKSRKAFRPPQDGLPRAAGEFFISHSRSDGDFAELLKLKLDQKGYTAWIDTDRLGPGVDWRQEIDEAIKRATAVIAIMSVEARESEYVTYEWAFAWGAGVKLIPIMLHETPLHPRLAALQYLNFTNRTARPWDRLLDALDEVN
jgi:hypothetical protein